MPDENIIFSQVDNKWSSLSENPNNSYFEIHDENKTLKEEKEKLLNEFIYLRNELSQKVNDQEYVLNEVMQSTSWKMTLPIRKLGSYLKK
ncbi:hypothetical protein [Photobacterium kishitanii]|uniref:hypothetical protein n=1 Tax=Photobacterium kishitanii TaxID=318456 RepID=UPI00273909CB|nr:hypothetical protein [Photobacterium kishitanii]